jgi:hypothetical protein
VRPKRWRCAVQATGVGVPVEWFRCYKLIL